jgi:hypothetical protein
LEASVPIGSPLLSTTAGLVTLELLDIPDSAYFPPSYVLTWLSLMPQLERLSTRFRDLVRNDVERQSHQTPDTVTLLNPQQFELHEGSAYLLVSAPLCSTPFMSVFLMSALFTVSVPNLEEVGYSGGSDVRDAFTTFLNERQVAGHPISLRLVDPSMFDSMLE